MTAHLRHSPSQLSSEQLFESQFSFSHLKIRGREEPVPLQDEQSSLLGMEKYQKTELVINILNDLQKGRTNIFKDDLDDDDTSKNKEEFEGDLPFGLAPQPDTLSRP